MANDSTAASTRAAGDSLEQKKAEEALVGCLSKHLGVPLVKETFHPDGCGCLEIDGYCESPAVLCEAWAHQGPQKPAQKHKVMSDAFKLLFASQFVPQPARLILVFGDETAAAHFKGDSWMANALRAKGIEVFVARVDEQTRLSICAAQQRQYR
jgi:hypothetical protein